jgi:hypothetical protein
MDTRFWGSLYAARYGAERMNGGSITFMSGTSAWKPTGGIAGRGSVLRRGRGLRAIAGDRSGAYPRQHDRARVHRYSPHRRAGGRAKASVHREGSIAAASEENRNARGHC